MKRKIASILLCLSLLLSLLSFTVSAAEQRQYVALGDSISAGAGIEDEEDRFVNIIATNNGYVLDNKANNDGNTAAGILTQFEEYDWDAAISGAELITITCGGNDMMDLLYEMVAMKYNANYDPDITAEEVPEILADSSSNLMQFLNLVSCAQEVLEGDPNNGVPAFADSDEFAEKLNEYIANLTTVMAYIRNLNEAAIVVITTQYNPYKSFAGGTYDVVCTEIGKGAMKLNEAIMNNAETANYLVADVYTAFEEDDRNLCNASDSPVNLDFHPNADGHTVIAACIQEVLDANTEHDCPSARFTDVNQNAWYHDAIDYVIENGLMEGTGTTTFDPEGTCTRGQIVTILWRLAGEPTPIGANPFTDVEANIWYTDAVIWAAEEEIVVGLGNGEFAPRDDVTREQLATILYRYAQYRGDDISSGEDADILDFADVEQISDWAMDAMRWAIAEGIVQGKGDSVLDPTGTATRSEVAQMMNFLEK